MPIAVRYTSLCLVSLVPRLQWLKTSEEKLRKIINCNNVVFKYVRTWCSDTAQVMIKNKCQFSPLYNQNVNVARNFLIFSRFAENLNELEKENLMF